MRRIIIGAAALTAIVAFGHASGHSASAAPAKPPVEVLTDVVCMTYEDGSGLCGKAHWEQLNSEVGPGWTPGDWVFDTITKRFCVRGNPCTHFSPDNWGDR